MVAGEVGWRAGWGGGPGGMAGLVGGGPGLVAGRVGWRAGSGGGPGQGGPGHRQVAGLVIEGGWIFRVKNVLV